MIAVKAVKGNKEYNIDESQKKSYQDAGFDIFDFSGNLIDYGKGKTVPYGKYMKLKTASEADKAELRAQLEAAKAELEAAKAELEAAKAERKSRAPKKAGE